MSAQGKQGSSGGMTHGPRIGVMGDKLPTLAKCAPADRRSLAEHDAITELRSLRNRIGWSRERLASELKLSVDSIERYETFTDRHQRVPAWVLVALRELVRRAA